MSNRLYENRICGGNLQGTSWEMVMIDISFEINGRKVSPNSVSDAFEKAVLDGITSSIKSSVGTIRCAVHGSSPRVTCKGRNLDNLSFEVSGCCQQVMDTVRKRLK